jgi:hypothetical protein
MRRLADFAFMLGDYKYALSTYDAVKKDFTGTDSFCKYLAGTQEMIGLCGLLADMSRGPFEPILDTATALYKEAKVPFFADRAVLTYFEMLKEHKFFREGSSLLIKASGEVSMFYL